MLIKNPYNVTYVTYKRKSYIIIRVIFFAGTILDFNRVDRIKLVSEVKPDLLIHVCKVDRF